MDCEKSCWIKLVFREKCRPVSILNSIGKTPILQLKTNSGKGELYAKAEFLNPTGSVKDRAAARMIQTAIEKEGTLTPDKEILDSSSGNTGISLASFGASLGIRVSIVLPESASLERRKLLRLYGANIIYSDPLEGSDGAIEVVRELYSSEPEKYYYMDQVQQ